MLLADYDIAIYNCDSYLQNDKEEFLDFIKKIAGKEHRTFPIIFSNAKYVGGYSELLVLLKDIFSRDD
jgi:glutaredoxin